MPKCGSFVDVKDAIRQGLYPASRVVLDLVFLQVLEEDQEEEGNRLKPLGGQGRPTVEIVKSLGVVNQLIAQASQNKFVSLFVVLQVSIDRTVLDTDVVTGTQQAESLWPAALAERQRSKAGGLCSLFPPQFHWAA